MKILLLGATGQVGVELLRTLPPLGEIVCAALGGELADKSHCIDVDFTRSASLAAAMDEANADIIVNAAAYTAVDRAEDEPELADRINHLAVAEIGAWAARHAARVIHYSTDYVFDGASTRPYREDDATAPLGIYGRTKLDGEQALHESGARHLLLRTAWVYAAHGHNFARTMLRLAGERDELRVVSDQIGAPTPARLIAETTTAALRAWLDRGDIGGTYHVVSAGRCSWFDFAVAILHGAVERGLIERLPRMDPIATADYPTRARRPAFSVLDCGRIEAALGIQLPSWESGLTGVLDELASQTAGR
ncbi:MAG TPA: dTDP-4-dehydrorhamnose reductase [Rhodanobacteraceae bacterium]